MKISKQKAKAIIPDYPHSKELIEQMWETIDNANGCGLAAPQIGKSICFFVTYSKLIYNGMNTKTKFFDEDDKGIKGVFINPELIAQRNAYWNDIERCLSVPNVSGKVERPWKITMQYQDENFKTFEKEFTGMTARVLPHEYDYIEGMLYIDRLKPLSKQMIASKLKIIIKGKTKNSLHNEI